MGDETRKVNWISIFAGDNKNPNSGVRRFQDELPRVMGFRKRVVTRGHIAHAFYRSGVVNNPARAEALCEAMDREGELAIEFGGDTYCLIKQDDGRYKTQIRTTRLGPS